MKYFVEVNNKGAFHVEIEDARDVYLLMEQIGEIEEGTAHECYDEGREVTSNKCSARRIWGEEMSDKELFIRTMQGKVHKKAAMTVSLPKPKKKES